MKIGAGVVAGAVVAGVGVGAYESSIVGANDSSSSATVASLQNELTTTQSQLSDTMNSLSNANQTISSLNSQLTATQGALNDAQGSLSAANSQNTSLSSQNSSLNSQNSSLTQQLTTTQGSLSSANQTISTLQTQVSNASSTINSLQSQASSLQAQIATTTGFLNLNTTEQACVEAMAEAIIPTDSNGPGAKEAGVIYFIDRQLASDYGKNANIYWKAPYVLPGVPGPITIAGTTYSGGSMIANPTDGSRYQYGLLLRDFWRSGILAFEAYCNSAYGGNFEKLSAANQVAALTDLTTNKPASFNDIVPSDFFNEVFFMTWSGFLMDPLYGGNLGMVGWELTGFPGVNMGNFYGEGMTSQQLMLATTPTKLRPASLAQFQQAAGAGT